MLFIMQHNFTDGSLILMRHTWTGRSRILYSLLFCRRCYCLYWYQWYLHLRRRLRSCTDRSHHNTFGDRRFAVAGPRVWNSLLAHLRNEDITYGGFRRELKRFCFNVASGGAMRLVLIALSKYHYLLTYLLTSKRPKLDGPVNEYARNKMSGVDVRRKIINRRAVWRPLCITFIMISLSILFGQSGLRVTTLCSEKNTHLQFLSYLHEWYVEYT